MDPHPLGGVECGGGVAALRLEPNQRRECGRGVAGKRAPRPHARGLAHLVYGVDGRTCGSERCLEVAALGTRPRFCQKRAPEHVRNRETNLSLPRVSRSRDRVVVFLQTGERLREADAGTRGLLVRVGRREGIDGTPVGHGGLRELVLRRLGEAKADRGACDALAVVDACTCFDALFVSALRCAKGASQEIDEREVLPDTAGIR